MQPFKHILVGLLLIAFMVTSTIANSSGLNSQATQSSSRLANIVYDVAERFGYRALRGIQVPDQWTEEESQGWLVDHAHLTLFGKDSDNSCLGINGRIGITILTFKDQETALRQLAKMREYHSGNMGFKVIREDAQGYFVKEVNGLYAAVISGSDVLLLEDRSRMQAEPIKAIIEAAAAKTR